MKDLKDIQDNIELYLKGKLKGSDLNSMEKLIAANPTVASEVELQKIITTTIRDDRKLALKARLSNIQLPPVSQTYGLTHTISKFATLKTASIIIASVSAGLAGYLFIANNREDESHAKASRAFEKQLHEVPATESLAVENQAEQMIAETAEPVLKPASEKRNDDPIVEHRAPSTNIHKEAKDIKNNRPNADGEKQLEQKFEDPSDADVKTDSNLPAEIIKSEEVTKTSDVDIKNINDGKHSFHYMFKESVLYLYGNFEASPYEILEFNDKDGQAIYLYYDKSFFALKTGISEISKLKKITDDKLIGELNLARNKKH